MERNCSLFGINIAVGTKNELYGRCAGMIGRGGAISTVNPEIMSNSLKLPELREALSSSLCIPDGIGIELALRMKGCKSERFPGVDLARALLEGERCVHLGIIGGKEGIAESAMQMLVMKHRNVIPEFSVCGYGIDYGTVSNLLSEVRPDVVFVCLGSPMQELFIKRMQPSSPRTLFIALGGSADIYSGEKERAPSFICSLGLEWAWRMIREPKRLKRLPAILSFYVNLAKNHRKSVKIGKKAQKTNQ